MSLEIAWDTIINRLNNHTLMDSIIEEDLSEPI